MTTEITADDKTAGAADAATKAANDAKDRIRAILNSAEAKGREALAQHFAFETDMSAEGALAALKVSPQASAETGKPESYTQRRMNAAGLAQPGGAGASSSEKTPTNVLSDAVARANKRR